MGSGSKKPIENSAYLKGIREADTAILDSIFKEFQPGVIRFVCANGGAEDEAKDVFAIALEALFLKTRENPDLELPADFGAYFFGICRFQWLQMWKKKQRLLPVTPSLEQALPEPDESRPDLQLEKAYTDRCFWEIFQRLDTKCRRILNMRWEKQPYETIARELGYSSKGMATKRKMICEKRLRKLLEKDPKIQEIYGRFH